MSEVHVTMLADTPDATDIARFIVDYAIPRTQRLAYGAIKNRLIVDHFLHHASQVAGQIENNEDLYWLAFTNANDPVTDQPAPEIIGICGYKKATCELHSLYSAYELPSKHANVVSELLQSALTYEDVDRSHCWLKVEQQRRRTAVLYQRLGFQVIQSQMWLLGVDGAKNIRYEIPNYIMRWIPPEDR